METPDQVRGGFGSEPQNHLRDDVALDLVRSAIDGRLAHVEIGRRGAVCIVGPDRMLIVALSETAKVRSAIMADGFERQFGQPLLDFAALDLEQARLRPRTLRSEEHTSELQSLMRISYAAFCL